MHVSVGDTGTDSRTRRPSDSSVQPGALSPSPSRLCEALGSACSPWRQRCQVNIRWRWTFILKNCGLHPVQKSLGRECQAEACFSLSPTQERDKPAFGNGEDHFPHQSFERDRGGGWRRPRMEQKMSCERAAGQRA